MKNLIYWGYALAWKIISFLPEKLIYSLSGRIADFIWRKGGKGVQRLRFNYARIHPEFDSQELDALTRAGMRSYLRYWIDTFRFPSWSSTRTIETVSITNENYLRDVLAQGNGAIVSLPHAGNWDHAGAYFCATGAPLVTVAEHLEPEKLFRKFLSYREAIGMEVLDLNARSIAVLSQRARAGKLIALVADRDLSRNGIAVQFAGHPARMPAGPALLSVQTGAPLLTAYVSYTDSGIHIEFGEVIPIPHLSTSQEKVSVMTQQVADWFFERIYRKTADWHMLQRIWVDGDFQERE